MIWDSTHVRKLFLVVARREQCAWYYKTKDDRCPNDATHDSNYCGYHAHMMDLGCT